jgi:hypothetical protein
MSHFDRRIEVVKAPKKDPRGIFVGRELKRHGDEFWFLDPMPTKTELEEYYRNEYWNHRSDSSLVTERDLIHFDLIVGAIPDFFSKKRKILNFGAGRGGISFLFSIAGHEVVNIEPSSQNYNPGFGIKTFSSLEDYRGNDIDFVYGSHSLEHVHNVHEVLKKINTLLRPISFSFWEVPNAISPGSGPSESKIFVPHTYYFLKRFFELHYKESVFNMVGTDVRSEGLEFPLGNHFIKSSKGDVIRFLGSRYSKLN